jgi:mutator protein MutT
MRVVAALIERDGKILVCQRRAGDRFEFKWEFPGGKVEANEEPRAALQRELREELAIEATIGEEIARYEYEYPGKKPILLIFCRVDSFEGEPVNQVFASMQWTFARDLPALDFLDGDIDFVRRLARGAI